MVTFHVVDGQPTHHANSVRGDLYGVTSPDAVPTMSVLLSYPDDPVVETLAQRNVNHYHTIKNTIQFILC
jgi:hypothetical protein